MSSWLKRKEGWLNDHTAQKPKVLTEIKNEEKTDLPAAEKPVYGVIYRPLKCPRCKSTDIKTHTTRWPVRYHRCKKCHFNFRSIEAEA